MHLLTRPNEQRRLATIHQESFGLPHPSSPLAYLVSALSSQSPVVRRRATGAIYNACADDTALEALVDVGAASALALHLKTTPIQPVSLKALERLCLISAVAREDATNALPDGELTQRLADLLTSSSEAGAAAAAAIKAHASKLITAFSKSESRHWLPVSERREPIEWPDDSIVYYTGVALEPWGPERLNTGLGGSETAGAACVAMGQEVGR